MAEKFESNPLNVQAHQTAYSLYADAYNVKTLQAHADQIADSSSKLFNAVDKNSNGVLSREELKEAQQMPGLLHSDLASLNFLNDQYSAIAKLHKERNEEGISNKDLTAFVKAYDFDRAREYNNNIHARLQLDAGLLGFGVGLKGIMVAEDTMQFMIPSWSELGVAAAGGAAGIGIAYWLLKHHETSVAKQQKKIASSLDQQGVTAALQDWS